MAISESPPRWLRVCFSTRLAGFPHWVGLTIHLQRALIPKTEMNARRRRCCPKGTGKSVFNDERVVHCIRGPSSIGAGGIRGRGSESQDLQPDDNGNSGDVRGTRVVLAWRNMNGD
jgi:hypothetical protein